MASGGSGPTKQEIWEELLKARDQQDKVSEKLMFIVSQNTDALTQSAKAMSELQGTVSSLADRFDATTDQMGNLVQQVTSAICNQQTGVPIKTFYVVVAVLVILLVAVAGIDIAGLGAIFGG